jgi:hypothetical protein
MPPVAKASDLGTKRQNAEAGSDNAAKSKKPRVDKAQSPALITAHEPILAELASKYNILPASVISSTKIQKRVSAVVTHLAASSDKPHVALLYARPAEVCKLITIAEQSKRVMVEEGKPWHQYNQLFALPAPAAPRKEAVGETVLDEAAEGSDSDGFEYMETRFEKAVLPSVSPQVPQSMRVFLSVGAVPELRLKDDVTSQSNEDRRS